MQSGRFLQREGGEFRGFVFLFVSEFLGFLSPFINEYSLNQF